MVMDRNPQVGVGIFESLGEITGKPTVYYYADSRQSLSNLYGSDRIRSEIRDFLSDLDTEEESSSVVSHASVTGETALTRRAYLGAY